MLFTRHRRHLQACSQGDRPVSRCSSQILCRFTQRNSLHGSIPATENSKASSYLAQRLNIHLEQLPAWENNSIAELDVDRDLEPNINLLLEIESEQRVNALLRNHPELLGVPLNGWQNFLLQYGISSRFFFQLLRTHPHIFIQGSLYTAGQNMMFLQGIGLSTRDISAHVIPRAPEVLVASIKDTLLPVVMFLSTPLQLQQGQGQAQPASQPETNAVLSKISLKLEDVEQLNTLASQPGMGLSKSQLRSILSRCPGLLLMSVDHSLRPRFNHLWQSLDISKEQAQVLLYVNTALLISPVQPQVDSHLQFLTKTCGFTEQQAKHVLVTCTDLVILSIGNLTRKWSYLVNVMFGHETQDAIHKFHKSLLDAAHSHLTGSPENDSSTAHASEAMEPAEHSKTIPRSAEDSSSIQQTGVILNADVLARAAVIAYPPFFSKSLLAETGPRFSYVKDKGLIHHTMAFNDQAHCVNLSLDKLLDGNTQQFLSCVHGDDTEFAKYIDQWRRGKAGLLTVTGNNVVESSW